MNPKPIHVVLAFAVISITALTMQLVSDFWLPFVLGAGVVAAVAIIARR